MPRGVWKRPRTPGVPPKRTTTPRNWTREQVELLEEQYGRIPNEQLAKRLGRSVWGMRLKAVKLGILPWKYTTLSKDDVALVLGQTGHRALLRWIEAGWLRARRVPGRGQGGFRYIIEEQDLVAFLSAHDEQVNRRLVDPVYRRHVRQWITTGEVFRRGGPEGYRACEAAGVEIGWRGARPVVLESDLPRLIEYRRSLYSDEVHRRRWLVRAQLRRRTYMRTQQRRHAA